MAKVIYHLSFEDPFEADAFFDAKGKLITWWSCNDAHWRGEYMSGLISHCGYEIAHPKAAMEKKLRALFIKETEDY